MKPVKALLCCLLLLTGGCAAEHELLYADMNNSIHLSTQVTSEMEMFLPDDPHLNDLYQMEERVIEACATLNEAAKRRENDLDIGFDLWWQLESDKEACREASKKATKNIKRILRGNGDLSAPIDLKDKTT